MSLSGYLGNKLDHNGDLMRVRTIFGLLKAVGGIMVRRENLNVMTALQAERGVHNQSLCTTCNAESGGSQYGLIQLRKWPDTRWNIWDAVCVGRLRTNA